MIATPTTPTRRESREDKVRRFRELYLAGRLDEVLIPQDADLTRLVAAAPALPVRWSSTTRTSAGSVRDAHSERAVVAHEPQLRAPGRDPGRLVRSQSPPPV